MMAIIRILATTPTETITGRAGKTEGMEAETAVTMGMATAMTAPMAAVMAITAIMAATMTASRVVVTVNTATMVVREDRAAEAAAGPMAAMADHMVAADPMAEMADLTAVAAGRTAVMVVVAESRVAMVALEPQATTCPSSIPAVSCPRWSFLSADSSFSQTEECRSSPAKR